MTITTLDGALAGMRTPRFFTKPGSSTSGHAFSTWPAIGQPVAGTSSGTAAGGVDLSCSSAPVAGQIPRVDPAGGSNAYLARLQVMGIGGTCLAMLCDRIKYVTGNSVGSAISVTSTSLQTINSNAIAGNRDANGANLGAGVQIGLEVAAAMGASAPGAITLGYTGDVNGAGQTANVIDPGLSSAALGSFHRFTLAAGDTGVKSVETFTLASTWTSGTLALVFYRVLAMIDVPLLGAACAIDAFTGGFPQIFNGTVPFFLLIPNGSNTGVGGHYVETQG